MTVFTEWVADRNSSYINILEAIRYSKYYFLLKMNFGIEVKDLAADTWIRAWSNKERKDCIEHRAIYSGKMITEWEDNRAARQSAKMVSQFFLRDKLRAKVIERKSVELFREYLILTGGDEMLDYHDSAEETRAFIREFNPSDEEAVFLDEIFQFISQEEAQEKLGVSRSTFYLKKKQFLQNCVKRKYQKVLANPAEHFDRLPSILEKLKV
jgi:DNA-directed RNA polymerase specialized sigma24 family protein